MLIINWISTSYAFWSIFVLMVWWKLIIEYSEDIICSTHILLWKFILWHLNDFNVLPPLDLFGFLYCCNENQHQKSFFQKLTNRKPSMDDHHITFISWLGLSWKRILRFTGFLIATLIWRNTWWNKEKIESYNIKAIHIFIINGYPN